jgi:hypothetical protein
MNTTKPGTVLATVDDSSIVFDGTDQHGMALAHLEDATGGHPTQYLGSIVARLGAYVKMAEAGRRFKPAEQLANCPRRR